MTTAPIVATIRHARLHLLAIGRFRWRAALHCDEIHDLYHKSLYSGRRSEGTRWGYRHRLIFLLAIYIGALLHHLDAYLTLYVV